MATVQAASNATVTRVATSTVTAAILAANGARKGFIINNESAVDCYLKFGATASATSYTIKLTTGQIYESGLLVYTGVIHAILASSTGNAQVTELT